MRPASTYANSLPRFPQNAQYATVQGQAGPHQRQQQNIGYASAQAGPSRVQPVQAQVQTQVQPNRPQQASQYVAQNDPLWTWWISITKPPHASITWTEIIQAMKVCQFTLDEQQLIFVYSLFGDTPREVPMLYARFVPMYNYLVLWHRTFSDALEAQNRAGPLPDFPVGSLSLSKANFEKLMGGCDFNLTPNLLLALSDRFTLDPKRGSLPAGDPPCQSGVTFGAFLQACVLVHRSQKAFKDVRGDSLTARLNVDALLIAVMSTPT